MAAATKLERARGTRDFAAEDALLRQQVVGTLKRVFELYGYNPLETPVLERFETLASKYAGGEEILKETFKLKDQGGRELGLRYDLTVPMCRFIATNPNLKMPFKRYQIGSVFRDGPLKTGRYREFVQCDIDVVGVKSINAEIELLTLTYEIFKKLGLSVEIRVNSRKISNAILEIVEAPKETEKRNEYLILFDKKEKMPMEEFKKELKRLNVADKQIVTLFTSTNRMELKALKEYAKEVLDKRGKFKNSEYAEGFEEVEEILSVLKYSEISNVVFDGTLARGLSYYTGTVFEVFLKKSEITSAVAAGGRYDKMIGNFVGGGREYPAVGISFGLDIIEDALVLSGREKKMTTTSVYVVPIKAVAEAQKIAAKLRQDGISTDIDMSNRDVKKNLEYAAAAGMPYVVFVGQKEVAEGKVKLREMKSGEEKTVTVQEAVRILRGVG